MNASEDPGERYARRLTELQNEVDAAGAAIVTAGGGLLLALVAGGWLGLQAMQGALEWWWVAVPLAGLVPAGRRLWAARGVENRVRRVRRWYAQAKLRTEGNWSGEGESGEEFEESDHAYARDLNLFGEGSLFELLCTTRTAIGRRGLAEYLLRTPSREEALARQEAVRELREDVGLREEVAALGAQVFHETRWETFAEWLAAPPEPIPMGVRVGAAVVAAAGLVMLGAGAIGLVEWRTVGAGTVVAAAVGSTLTGPYRERVTGSLMPLRMVAAEIPVLRAGLALLGERQFAAARLRELTARGAAGAPSLRRLERMLAALNERNQELFYMPSIAVMWATQWTAAIEAWRVEHGEELREWIAAWGEFEALLAVSAYAFEQPEDVFPELAAGAPMLEAEALGHPLLPRAGCVRNDLALGEGRRFYLISGSNAAGKTTLLRSIGLNAVLAGVGAPVRARRMRLTDLAVGASLAVTDSLQQGRSKFLAEVERLRQILELAERRPVLFLIDEIFSGTNSRDRRAAGEAVVKTLLARGAIGALSTHDLALTEIAALEGWAGENVHMGSRDRTDPLDFDYLLKPGVTTESNALAIARLAGVPV